jgi:hypothetical protein
MVLTSNATRCQGKREGGGITPDDPNEIRLAAMKNAKIIASIPDILTLRQLISIGKLLSFINLNLFLFRWPFFKSQYARTNFYRKRTRIPPIAQETFAFS